jgi:hypothetical protein
LFVRLELKGWLTYMCVIGRSCKIWIIGDRGRPCRRPSRAACFKVLLPWIPRSRTSKPTVVTVFVRICSYS